MRRHRSDRPRGGEGAMDITAIAIAVLVGLALLAAAARACRRRRAKSPRWTKSPLMAQMTAASSPSRRRTAPSR